jgi:tetratricopeptide (TPR) repeat protein
MTLPATLRDSLMARLDRVTAVKEVAQIGATIGRDFSYELLAAVSPMTRTALEDALERLIDSGLAFRRGRIPDAIYTFKHALVQDAAYDSLLKSRRQALHGSIAGILEARYPETVSSAPELLARHYSAAAQHEQAVHFWLRASEAALNRLALPEAIAALRAGLRSAAELPAGTERDLATLTLQTMLGPALLAHRGWAYPEVSAVLEPAWQLAETYARTDSYLPILHGLWVHHMSGGRLATSVQWATRMLERADGSHDESLAIAGRRAMMTSLFFQGDLTGARTHGDVIVAQYDPSRHGQIAARTHSDPLTGDGIYRAHYLWMLGFPDQARSVADLTAEHARQRAHPFDVAFALTLGAQVFDYCGEPERLLQCAADAERIGREFGVPLMSEIMAEISKGEGWLQQGRVADSVVQLRESITRLNATGHRVWVGYLQCRLGEAMAREGDVAGGLTMVQASLADGEFREDRVHLAEMLRLQGWMHLQLDDLDRAEAVLQESLDVSRAQQAKSWELRTATTLAEVYVRRGDQAKARQVLAPVDAWFTEGFDTQDLRKAHELLHSLQE